MANEDILGGLKSALTRGYSLEEAMVSFYNAGYKKEDIEDAARELQMQQIPAQNVIAKPKPPVQPKSPATPVQTQPKQSQQPVSTYIAPPKFEGTKEVEKGVWTSKSVSEEPKKTETVVKPVKVEQPQQQPVKKQVSAYQSYDSRIKQVTIVLVILLIVLLGILGIILTFKQQLISFFNNLF